ncbi:MAG: hypothetical protein WDO12_09300 [Pseudomonadota bacterium]
MGEARADIPIAAGADLPPRLAAPARRDGRPHGHHRALLHRGQARIADIGRGVFIGRGSELALHDRIRIGEYAVINRRVTILTGSHDLRDELWRMYTRPVVIE